MNKGFKNIIVPVYSTLNAASAIVRAIDLADEEEATIHLFQIRCTKMLSKLKFSLGHGIFKKEESDWAQKFQSFSNIHFKESSINEDLLMSEIAYKTLQANADLIVLANFNGWEFLRGKTIASAIGTATGLPVFSAKKNKSYVTSVVIPMEQNLQKGLLEKIMILNKKNNLDIHLVTYKQMQPDGKEELASLAVLQAYQWFKSYIKCPVDYTVLSGANKIKVFNNYLHHFRTDVVYLQ